MLKRLPLIISLMLALMFMLALASLSLAQNTNSNAPQTRQRTTTKTSSKTSTTSKTNANKATPATPSSDASNAQNAQQPAATTQPRVRRAAETNATRTQTAAKEGAKDPTARGVLAAFESLLEGIRHADVDAVTAAYWNSPQLILFNNNGTVTRGWEQLHENRANSYPNMKDVKLDVRDLRVQMLGRDGALLTCLWNQSQVYKGSTETATGRMTIVFRRVGNAWKAIHLHTSPDAPEPTRLPPSEQTTPTPKPRTTP